MEPTQATIFVGRQREMDELRAALDAAAQARGRLVMLVGEPGIGKTRTAQELASLAEQRGAAVLWGRCYESGGAPPYWPWTQIIRSYALQRDTEELRADLGSAAPDIAGMATEVWERLPDIKPPAVVEDPEQARFRLFDSVTGFLKTASRRQPIVLVLDNLHAADKPSLLLLEFLAQEIARSRLLVLGTYRDVELSRQHPLSETLAELARQAGYGGFQRLTLRGVAAEDVRRFIEVVAGITPHPSLVKAIHEQTEGNPLFVTEVVRLLVQEGQLGPGDSLAAEQRRTLAINIPEGIREVIGRRLNRLSPSCTQVLTLASAIGREFGLNELAHLAEGMSEEELIEALEQAVEACVIEEVPQARERYQFTHVLIRETLYDELTSARRARLHRQIGEAMEDLYGSAPEPHLAQLAHHFFEAARSGGAEKAIDYARRAGDRDMALVAYEEAARHYQLALDALDVQKSADETLRCDLLLALGEAQRRAGEYTQARQAFESAAQMADRMASSERLVRAALGFEEASWRPGLYGGPAARLLERALRSLPEAESVNRLKLMVALVRALHFAGQRQEAQPIAQQAIAMARRIGDPSTLASALNIIFFSRRSPDDHIDRLVAAEEVIKLAEDTGDMELIMDTRTWHMFDLLEVGNMEAARATLRSYEQMSNETRQPFYQYVGAACRVTLAIAEGRLSEAEELAHKALTIGQRLRGQDASGVFGVHMFTIRREQGRLHEVAPAVKMFVEQRSASAAWRPGLAVIYAELGMEDEARAEFEHLAADDFAAVPLDALWVLCVSYLAEVCAWLRDTERAAILYRLLLPYEGHNVVIGGGVAHYGSASRYLGMLASALQRWDDAERHFQDALAMDTRTGARTWLAHTHYCYARMLHARNNPGDRQKASDLLDAALMSAREIVMQALERRAAELQQLLQAAEAPSGDGPSAAKTYPDDLTEREVDVLRLIAAGRSNRDIAQELFISPNTVANHVKNILSKTGAANRTEAAAYAIRHRLV